MDKVKDIKKQSSNGDVHFLSYLRYVRYMRPLIYSNEIGESFRNIVPRIIIPAYTLSFGYVFADIFYNVYPYYFKNGLDNIETKKALSYYGLWHGFSSLLLPTLTISGTVKLSNLATGKLTQRYVPRKLIPMITGLSIIPFIIKPIDELTHNLVMKPIFGDTKY